MVIPLTFFSLLRSQHCPSDAVERSFPARLTFSLSCSMVNAKVIANRPPHSRPSSTPSILPAHAVRTPSLVASPKPSTSSLLGYTSPVRTISPRISNPNPSPQEIVKAIAPHVLDARRTRRIRAPSKSGPPSRPPKPYHQLPLHVREEASSGQQQPWSGSEVFSCMTYTKKLKPSPLRAVVVYEDSSVSHHLREFVLLQQFEYLVKLLASHEKIPGVSSSAVAAFSYWLSVSAKSL